jgi:LPXTG-site transpeptidase (sortase) family protein
MSGTACAMLLFLTYQNIRFTSVLQTLSHNTINYTHYISMQSKKAAYTQNTLIIPKINITTLIVEGEYENDKTYAKIWRRTHTSTPEKGSNTVLVGHRYYDNEYNYPLYAIDELTVGDTITVYWDQKEYTYTIYNTMTVNEDAIEIENPSDESRLTLYSCDWSGKKRLVTQARLNNESNKRPPVQTSGFYPKDVVS